MISNRRYAKNQSPEGTSIYFDFLGKRYRIDTEDTRPRTYEMADGSIECVGYIQMNGVNDMYTMYRQTGSESLLISHDKNNAIRLMIAEYVELLGCYDEEEDFIIDDLITMAIEYQVDISRIRSIASSMPDHP